MRRFKLCRTYREKNITADVIQTQRGVQITLFGGDLPHIGAVAVVDPEGNCTLTEFPSHREGVVSDAWAAALAAAGICPAVVTAGIHYDGISREEIKAVVAQTEELLRAVLKELSDDGSGTNP